jgi:hypothetical protein
MIYGQAAKDICSSYRGKVVSEGDAVLEFLQSEIQAYNTIVFNESYIDEEERMIAEAKLQALNEAFVGAIIAAIVALIGVVIAIIAKATGLFQKAANDMKETREKIKNNAKNVGAAKPKTVTADQIEAIKTKVKEIANKLNYEHKDQITGYSDENFMEINLIPDGPKVFKELLEQAKRICTITSSSSADEAKEVIESVSEEMNKLRDDYFTSGYDFNDLKKDNEGQKNTFLDSYIKKQVPFKDDMRFLDHNYYYNKAVQIQKNTETEAEALKDYLDKNSKNIKKNLHPDSHGGDNAFNGIFVDANKIFDSMKDIIESYKVILTKWVEAESFRLKVSNVYFSYKSKL